MKTINYFLLSALFSMFTVSGLYSQKEYLPVNSEEGIEFSYLWKRSKVLKKDSPMILFLKIHNSNEYIASVDFTVDYFWNGVRSASSEPNNQCIKAGKTLKGKIKNLTYEKAGYTDQDISSVNFDLDISGISVSKVDRCRKKKKE